MATQDQNPASATPTFKDDSPVMATVNGSPVTEAMVELYQKQRQSNRPNDPSSDNRHAVLEELINLELARQDGVAQGVDQNAGSQLMIAQQTRAVIANAAIQRQMELNPVTDEELKKIYDEKVPTGNEYKARHILVKEQKEANELIAELDKGADFAELAKQHSTGPSGKNGGDLGWFSPQQMVKPFSDATAKLEKGSYTKEPVETQFGWHVILLEDVREMTPPPFDQLKPQIEAFAQSQRVQAYINGLRTAAAIDMKVSPPTAEEPAAPAAAEDPAAPAAAAEDPSDPAPAAAEAPATTESGNAQ
jgi:peptidyl-prolyl cis-trans isomerase C